jgi:hypothetical protein
VHLKLGMAVTDFIRALNPIVASVSHPRAGDEDAVSAMRKGTTQAADKDLQKIMERRREQTDSDKATIKEPVKKQVEANTELSGDLQVIMEKRRLKTEEEGVVDIVTTSPIKESLKSVKLSSDLQEIMARRRQMAGAEE